MIQAKYLFGAATLLATTLLLSAGDAEARTCRCRGAWRHHAVVYSSGAVMTPAPATITPMTTPQPEINNAPPSAPAPTQNAPAPPASTSTAPLPAGY